MKNTPLSDQYVSFAEMQEDLQKLGWVVVVSNQSENVIVWKNTF
jgi:hypothetical protein